MYAQMKLTNSYINIILYICYDLTSMSKILLYYNLRQFEFIGTYSTCICGLPFYFLNYGNI